MNNKYIYIIIITIIISGYNLFSSGFKDSTCKFSPGVVNIVEDPEILRQIKGVSDRSLVKSSMELMPGDVFFDENTKTARKVVDLYVDESTNTLRVVTDAPELEEVYQNYFVPKQEVDFNSVDWDNISANSEGIEIVISDEIKSRGSTKDFSLEELKVSISGEINLSDETKPPKITVKFEATTSAGTISTEAGQTAKNVDDQIDEMIEKSLADKEAENDGGVEVENTTTVTLTQSLTIQKPTIQIGLNLPTLANPVSGGIWYELDVGFEHSEEIELKVATEVKKVIDLATIPIDGGAAGGLISLNIQLVFKFDGSISIVFGKKVGFGVKSSFSVRYTPQITMEKKSSTIKYWVLKKWKWRQESVTVYYSVPALTIKKDLLKNETSFPKREITVYLKVAGEAKLSMALNMGPAITFGTIKVVSLTLGMGPYISLSGEAMAYAKLFYEDQTISAKPVFEFGLAAEAKLEMGPFVNVTFDLLDGWYTSILFSKEISLLSIEAKAALTAQLRHPYTELVLSEDNGGGFRITSPFCMKEDNEIYKTPADFIFDKD